jgi:hypothetical protein
MIFVCFQAILKACLCKCQQTITFLFVLISSRGIKITRIKKPHQPKLRIKGKYGEIVKMMIS